MNLWKKISNLGVDQDVSDIDKKRARLTNRMIFITFFLTLPYFPVFISQGVMIPVVKMIIFNVILFSLFIITNKGKHELAAIIFCIVIILHIASDSVMNEDGTGKFYLIPISIIGFTILKQTRIAIALFAFSFVAFFIAHFLPEYVDPIVTSKVKGAELKFIINLTLIFFGTLYFIWQLISTNSLYENAIIKQKTQIEDQHKELQASHKSIQDSIAYAKRIQNAIMPPLKQMQDELKDCFVYYKPKDVVAGDFYWMEKVDDKLFFAAADCTGHGVPGAMVSVICNNALNRTVREYDIFDPGKILDRTKEIVVREFEKSEENVRDGMDIALCTLQGNKLEYAGANNPAWIIRGGELIEFKADRQPIGKFAAPKPYTTHSIELEKDDVVYLFTDGYADQFGGDQGKKFKIKNMMDLFKKIYAQPMDQQMAEIDRVMLEWKGNFEQIDDICVIGVRF